MIDPTPEGYVCISKGMKPQPMDFLDSVTFLKNCNYSNGSSLLIGLFW